MLEEKYGRREEWLEKVERRKGSVWWQDLRKICQLDEDRGWLLKNLRRKMGNGRNIKF